MVQIIQTQGQRVELQEETGRLIYLTD